VADAPVVTAATAVKVAVTAPAPLILNESVSAVVIW
jgi:hypothetical protein